MYVAAQDGNLELLTYHIRSGIDPNYQHPEILSLPLVTAILNGHTEISIYLLTHGANPEIKSYYDDMTAIEAAIKTNNEIVLTQLNQMGFSTKTTWFQKILKRLKK